MGEFPLMVPTLSGEELSSLLSGERPSDEVYRKASHWAASRREAGRSPFADPVGIHAPAQGGLLQLRK